MAGSGPSGSLFGRVVRCLEHGAQGLLKIANLPHGLYISSVGPPMPACSRTLDAPGIGLPGGPL